MHESLQKFRPYVKKGLLREVVSPCKKLVLYNYQDKCTYERAWDEVTLNARGTVYEVETGEVIARAFPKFFNLSELSPEKQKQVVESRNFEVYEKMDGSLGIVYYYDGEWRVNTRGSFTSDQAIKGKELLDSKYETAALDRHATYLCEVIYPENRIIVNYGQIEMLTFLAAFDNATGEEVKGDFETSIARIPSARVQNFATIQELQSHLETLDHTEEGYVVRLESGERVKFKSVEYLALARIMSNMSPLTFWSRMENGVIDREFLQQLPEEFRDECDKIADTLEDQHDKLCHEIYEEYNSIIVHLIESEKGDTRKELGLYLKENEVKHSAAMFPTFLNNMEALDKYIMKQIKPVGNVMKDI